MAWADVPAKMTEYEEIEYGGTEAVERLLGAWSADSIADIPVSLREDFEADLDYRLGACQNLVTSKAINPKLLQS